MKISLPLVQVLPFSSLTSREVYKRDIQLPLAASDRNPLLSSGPSTIIGVSNSARVENLEMSMTSRAQGICSMSPLSQSAPHLKDSMP
jgi:hypothetical protein